MAKMTLPTTEAKAKQVDKAQRHYDGLKKRHDAAEAIVKEVGPEMEEAGKYLEYLKGMPTRDGSAPEQTEDAQQTLPFEGADAGTAEDVFA